MLLRDSTELERRSAIVSALLTIAITWASICLLTLDPESGIGDQSVIPGGSAASSDERCALVDSIIEDALSYLGTPYLWGGTGPDGFDCSGLICRVFEENGMLLPRTVTAIEELGEPVEQEDLLPGDLLIFESPKHIGLYIGDGEFIHSSSYQDRGVVITELSQANYTRRYSTARRLIGIDI